MYLKTKTHLQFFNILFQNLQSTTLRYLFWQFIMKYNGYKGFISNGKKNYKEQRTTCTCEQVNIGSICTVINLIITRTKKLSIACFIGNPFHVWVGGGGGAGVWHKELFLGTMNNLQTRYNL